MYEKQPKKLLIVNILDILQKYTDANHRLSQRNIIDILLQGYLQYFVDLSDGSHPCISVEYPEYLQCLVS